MSEKCQQATWDLIRSNEGGRQLRQPYRNGLMQRGKTTPSVEYFGARQSTATLPFLIPVKRRGAEAFGPTLRDQPSAPSWASLRARVVDRRKISFDACYAGSLIHKEVATWASRSALRGGRCRGRQNCPEDGYRYNAFHRLLRAGFSRRQKYGLLFEASSLCGPPSWSKWRSGRA